MHPWERNREQQHMVMGNPGICVAQGGDHTAEGSWCHTPVSHPSVRAEGNGLEDSGVRWG